MSALGHSQPVDMPPGIAACPLRAERWGNRPASLWIAKHVKTLRSQKLRMLLTHRKLLQSKAIAIENDLRATLRN
jgi:hypothetical protein